MVLASSFVRHFFSHLLCYVLNKNVFFLGSGGIEERVLLFPFWLATRYSSNELLTLFTAFNRNQSTRIFVQRKTGFNVWTTIISVVRLALFDPLLRVWVQVARRKETEEKQSQVQQTNRSLEPKQTTTQQKKCIHSFTSIIDCYFRRCFFFL